MDIPVANQRNRIYILAVQQDGVVLKIPENAEVFA